jgi:hypothetical protein
MKKIKLTESQLHKVIKESVKKILRENFDDVTWIIVDKASDEIIGNYDSRWNTKEDAIDDADEKAQYGGAYDVYEVHNGDYDENDIVYSTDDTDYKF